MHDRRNTTIYDRTTSVIVKPSKKKIPILTSKVWLIIAINFVVTSILIGTTIVIANRIAKQDTPSTKNVTATVQQTEDVMITYLQGEAEYFQNDAWIPLNSSVALGESSEVRTLDNSRLILTLIDGSIIRLDSDTTIKIQRISGDEITIKNEHGHVYARVKTDDTRTFRVQVGDIDFVAHGTAYETINDDTEKGVRVFQHSVSVRNIAQQETLVSEGQQYFNLHEDTSLSDVVTAINLGELKVDDFIQWNRQQDEAEPAYKDQLGFLRNIEDENAIANQNSNTGEAIATTGSTGIIAVGLSADEGIVLRWAVNGVDTQWGFKVVYSQADTVPSYKESSAISAFASSKATSALVSITDGKVWHFRICAYRPDDSCKNYSNTLAVTAPYKEKVKVTNGKMTAKLDDSTLTWAYTGTASYGYKVSWNTSGSPTYPAQPSEENPGSTYISNPSVMSVNLANIISNPGSYYVRICAYTDGTESTACVDYSTAITYTKP